ncbi:MAG TPA: DUF1499 domain-containing protein [Pseudomonadaceae bacterium]|nr:DUF1499 domain-containing protein [Pseudomonadaceae bacterium]
MNETRPLPLWLVICALGLLLLGSATALGMLAGPLGVWLGLWSFPTAFSIMGTIYPFSGWIALGLGIASLVLLLLARNTYADRRRGILWLPVVATLACVIAWYIPGTFQAPAGESYPPIHDVSTDLDDIPRYVAVLPLRIDAPNSVVYGDSPNMTPERNAQLQREAYPDLVPQLYQASEEEMFERALAAVEAMGWELVEANPDEGRIEATATTFWLRFKDDVIIRTRSMGPTTVVDARSLSRVGGGDMGANAKRLRKFFEIL